jgi:hypothetical protein
MKVRKGKIMKVLHEIEDDFPWGWHPKCVRTFVERVHNDIGWAVIRQCKRLLEALHQYVISGFVSAVVVSHIYAVDHIAAKIGVSRELGKK